jgi:hypothetical protein
MLAGPLELAHGVRVPQQVMNHRLRERLLRAPRVQARLGDPLGAHLQRVVAGRGPLEELVDHRRGAGVGLDDALAIVAQDVDVLERRGGGPDPLGRLLAHPLGGRLGEVVDVVLRRQHADAVHELVGGPGLVGEDDALLDEVDLQVELVEDHPVLEVAIAAVGLLDEDRAAGCPVLLQPGQHLGEVGAARPLGGLHVDELLDHLEPLVVNVAVEEALVGGDGKAFALLLLRGDTRVDDAGPAGRRRRDFPCGAATGTIGKTAGHRLLLRGEDADVLT